LKKVVLISVGQPSTNPRLVKEANTLTEAGFDVYVIYSFWTKWAWEADQLLFQKVNWKPLLAGGSPFENKRTYFFSRLRVKVFGLIAKNLTFKFGIAEIARGRTYPYLLKKAISIKADLYIAHIQAALPAAVKAARKHKAKCGFDIEDFHRQEVDDDVNSYYFKISKFIEDKYLPLVNYITASSPLIAEQYTLLYKRTVTCILNVFPKTIAVPITKNENDPLKLFWFSQTIGQNRGLETIVEAMALTGTTVELHLLGQPADGYRQHLLQMGQSAGIVADRIFFYEPVLADQLFNLAAQFDIGLASETRLCLNRDISLTNKLFTYIQSGLAVAASNTLAQKALMDQYPQTGKTYNNAAELADILNLYNANRELLYQAKKEAFKVGQTELNWEIESEKFLKVIENV
jgi:glycosyltransferase involved in cell wall biosynthesis